MKTKRIIALTLSAAMAIGTAAMLTACKPTDNGGDPFEVDNTVYHCAGQSNGPEGSLYNQGWNQTSAGATENVTFVKDTTVTDKNVFTLEMKLYAGDQFKIVHDDSWAGELTTFYFVNAEEDSTYNYVAKTDGEVIFRDYSSSSSNITLADGHDGIYKFTLETNPAASEAKDMYKISYELVQSIDKLRIPYDMKVLGDFNVFGRLPVGAMTVSEGVWSTIIEITEDDLTRDNTGAEVAEGATHSAIYVANLGDGETDEDEMAFVAEDLGNATITVGGDDVEVNLVTAGKYTVTFDQETKAVTVSEIKDEWYVVIGDQEIKLTAQTSGAWTGAFTLTDAATGVKLVCKGENADEVTIGDLEAGAYVVKYDPETKAVTCIEKVGYYLVGDYCGWTLNETSVKLTESEETPGLWEVTVDWSGLEAEYVSFKGVQGNLIEGAATWYGHWYENQHPDGNQDDNDGGNFKIPAGKYHITINMNDYGKIGYELITDEAAE